jgi:voltage-gated sodium channel
MNYQSLQASFLRVKNNRAFEFVVIAIILLSALEIGAKTYALPETVLSYLSVLDILVTIFFLVEITIRFIAEPDKRHFFRNGWNVFDSLVVAISLIPISESEMALLARLIRVFRVLRMVSVIPELRILITSLLKALPQLGYVMLLMFIIFYIYAAIGSHLFSDINSVLWGNIAISMLTLFRIMTFEDWTDIQYETMDVYPFSWIYYLSFIFFTAFAFLNMVIGIVVNVMEEENHKHRAEQDHTDGKASLEDIQAELKLLREELSVVLSDETKNARK